MATSPEDIKHLKAMVAAAKKGPVNIAICLGKKPEDAVVMMDRIKAPESLGKLAKAAGQKAGQTSKVGIGVLTVEGKEATFKCPDKPPSGMAKQLKIYFKSIEMPLVFELVGADNKPITDEDTAEKPGAGEAAGEEQDEDQAEEPGQEQDEDTSTGFDPDLQREWDAAWASADPKVAVAIRAEGADAGKLRAVRDYALGKAETGDFEAAKKSLATLLGLIGAAPKPTQTTSETEPKTKGPDAKDIIARLTTIKPRLTEIKGPLAEKLTELFQKAVGLLKSGSTEAAAAELAKIETAFARLDSAKVTTSEPGSDAGGDVGGDAGKTPSGQDSTAAADPRFAKISTAEGQLRKQVDGLAGGDAQDAMLAILDTVVQAVEKGEAETALSGLKRIQDGLKLQAEIDRLAPFVATAASSGKVADVNALTLLFNSIVDKVPAPDHAKAMANLVRVQDMLDAGTGTDKSAFEQDQPLEIRPYAEARLNWALTRQKLGTEIGKLQDSISKTLAQLGLADQIKLDGSLFAHIEKLDARLESKLAEIVNSDAGDEREKLKSEARTLIAEYNRELASDFFTDVDDNNGFMPVAVTSSARDMLNNLSAVLAG